MKNVNLNEPVEPMLMGAIEGGQIPDNVSEMTIFVLSFLREKAILDHYEDVNRYVASREGKQIYGALVSEKKRNNSILKEYYAQFAQHLSLPTTVEELIGDYSLKLGKINKNADLQDICSHTMQHEMTACNFYDNALERCSNKALQKLFKFLGENERKSCTYIFEQFVN